MGDNMASSQAACPSGGRAGPILGVGALLIAITIIVGSTVDFHTGLIWGAPPRLNAEVRYITTFALLSIGLIYVYCYR
jgi:hypothetical protein